MKKTSQQLVPKLRFSEFQDPWRETKIADAATFRRGSFPQPYGLPEWYDETGGRPFVQVYDVADDFKLKPKTKQKISKAAEPKSVFVPEGSVVLTIQGSIGRIAITQYDAFVDRTLLIFTSFKIPLETVFFTKIIHLLFEHEKKLAPGGTIKTITKEALSSFLFASPTFPEQRKIAGFLSAVDTKIAQLAEKKRLLEDYKKGCMQQLFSQKTRFKDKDENDFPDWEEKQLGNILIESKERTSANNQYPILSSSRDGIVFQSEYFNHQTASEDNTGYKVIRRGQLTYRSMSDTGEFFFNIQEVIDYGIVSPAYPVFSINEMQISKFIWSSMNLAPEIKRQILMVKSGGTRLALPFSRLCQMKISVPHPTEQRKIADFLSALDRKIALVAEEHRQGQTFKKGLLQQMFV
jgi:type I restriction enzyme S subunit